MSIERRHHLAATLASLAVLASTLASGTAQGQFRGAVDVDQGAFLPNSYALNLVAVPGVDIGRLRLAADIGAALENPKWALIVGVRPSIVLWAPLTPETGLRLFTDFSYIAQGGWRWTGGPLIDLDSFHIGVSAGYDSFHDAALILTTVGIDLVTLGKFFAGDPLASPPPCETSPMPH